MKCVYRVFTSVPALVVAAGLSTMVGGVILASADPALAQSSNISVRGNSRIESDAVRAYFATQPGERLDNAKIDDAIKNLYATGLFQDVSVSRAGGGLVVTVVENSMINRVAFEGNRKIKDAVLESEVQSKSRGPFNRSLIQGDVQRILELYRRSGRTSATVEPQVISRPNGRVDLVFVINEDRKSKIAEIEFTGNNAFSDGRLRDEMTTTQTNFMSWLKTSDVYDPDRLNADLELVRRFYLRHGYADFRVASSDVVYDEAANSYRIQVAVEEGPVYRYSSVDVESNVSDVDPSVLRSKIKGKAGDIYSADEIEKTVEAMSVELATNGYAFAQVRPRGSRDYENHTVGVTYSVEEGSRVYVERINIRGNSRTRDYVVRREFDLAEGDAYNQALVNRAERRLNRLGFFKSVRVTSEPGSSPDRVVVNVNVEDQPTGEFSVSGGYSTADGFIAEVSVAEKNFLGRGYYVKVGASMGENSEGYDLSFTDPYFLGRRISAGFDLYMKNRDETSYSAYELNTIGGGLRLGLPITDSLTAGLNYQLYSREIEIRDGLKDGCYRDGSGAPAGTCIGGITDELDPREVSVALKQAEGETLTSLMGYSLVWNSLDSNLNPTNGIRAEFRQDVAGLGGDSQFVRTTVDARYYHQLPGEMVGMLRGQAGHVVGFGDDDLPILDHFFKGPDLVRGFKTSGIGARDRETEDALGGTVYAGASAEVLFPLFGIPKDFGLKGAVFADAGTLLNYDGCEGTCGFSNVDALDIVGDDGDIRSSVGVSLLWQSPLGPLRFDYAWVLTKDDADEEQAFRFSGGGRF
ncbi:outer membrane protein assembly factor BamA [Terrihabitans sp. B22-R8]|uniref:outer membrane protein assembly factor BamA n=1 Tax=Terrihabitans sp. B22-R8 TaxID=3425128 RepID=UPI00403CBB12